ncbi:hypothetical protein F7Q99_27830 [Streptomyces kaniharaensis]|uniref:Uncharacterized protein n=1 Tax=Streptomyces kaniharaensis TaxID=212423 RepID=A0A6N7KWR9_9ACTN|nr:hypothetical protein [Streptomyces kaniharaensis]
MWGELRASIRCSPPPGRWAPTFEEPVMAMPPEIDPQVVAALFQFRMATAEQLRVLHTPDSRPELMRRRLRRLKGEGLVEDVVLPQAGRLRAWFLTERGARIADRFPELVGVASPPLPEDKTEARLRVGHILAVTRTQAAFVAGARKAGDECRPLDFLPEVYQLRRRPRRRHHPRRPAALHDRRRRPGAAPGIRRGRPRHHGQREARVEADRLRPLPRTPPHPGASAAHNRRAERGAGLTAALHALPQAAVRPGRHRRARRPAAHPRSPGHRRCPPARWHGVGKASGQRRALGPGSTLVGRRAPAGWLAPLPWIEVRPAGCGGRAAKAYRPVGGPSSR